jgi:hypothetical protein
MDKTAQAARQARLAQALRTNLRRRKAGDAPRPAPDPTPQATDVEATPHSDASRDEPAT